MKSISGICSFSKNLADTTYYNKLKMNTEKIVFANENCLISLCGGKSAYREGVGLFFVGSINNTEEIKEKYRLKDKKEEELLISLYLLKGVGVYGCINGEFSLVIYNEIERTLYLGGDISGARELYLANDSNCLYFSSSLKGIIEREAIIPQINEEGVINLIASKALYTGEAIEGVKRLYSNECMLYSMYGAESIIFKKEFKDKPFITYTQKSYLEKGDSYMYCLCDSFFSMMNLRPDVIATSVKNNMFCDSLARECLGSVKLFDIDNINLPLSVNIPYKNYLKNYMFSLLCDMDYFIYQNEEDIEKAELMYLNLKCILCPILSSITKICDIFNLENNSKLITAVISNGFSQKSQVLFQKLLSGENKTINLTQDIKELGTFLYKNPQSPVFKIISRQDFLDAENEDILHILYLNHFLEVIRPHLKF